MQGKRQRRDFHGAEKQFEERVVSINHIAKVVKGGRRYRFSVVAVVGDRKGKVGVGTGKAIEIPDAIKRRSKTPRKISSRYRLSIIPFPTK